jgi:hypothetical protein
VDAAPADFELLAGLCADGVEAPADYERANCSTSIMALQ